MNCRLLCFFIREYAKHDCFEQPFTGNIFLDYFENLNVLNIMKVLNSKGTKDIGNMENIAIIINSHNEKLNSSTKWVKQMDLSALIVECKKLKSFEEKIWLKNELSFTSDQDRNGLVQSIYEMNSGNQAASRTIGQIKMFLTTWSNTQQHHTTLYL